LPVRESNLNAHQAVILTQITQHGWELNPDRAGILFGLLHVM